MVKVGPVIAKPAPLTPAWEMVKLPEPALLKMTVCLLLAPTPTLPKATLPGVALSWPVVEGGGGVWLPRPAQPAIAIRQNSGQPHSHARVFLRELCSREMAGASGWLRVRPGNRIIGLPLFLTPSPNKHPTPPTSHN